MPLGYLFPTSRRRSRALAVLCLAALVTTVASAPLPAAAVQTVLASDFESGSYAPWGHGVG